MAELPSLMQVRQAHKLESRQLADTAGVPLRVEFVAEIGGRVQEWEAELLLAALSKFAGKPYTLQNVQINIITRDNQYEWERAGRERKSVGKQRTSPSE